MGNGEVDGSEGERTGGNEGGEPVVSMQNKGKDVNKNSIIQAKIILVLNEVFILSYSDSTINHSVTIHFVNQYLSCIYYDSIFLEQTEI